MYAIQPGALVSIEQVSAHKAGGHFTAFTIVVTDDGISVPGEGVHLCMWGKVTPANNSALDMTLGLPADTLAWAGLKGVPSDGMLTIAVSGTADKPKIEWQE